MRRFYRPLLAAAALGVFAWSQPASAQDAQFTVCPDDQDVCVVEWDYDGDLIPEINALRNTIANDADGEGNTRPEGRVYVLRRGGLYYNEDRMVNEEFHLRLVGQTAAEASADDNVCGAAGNEDCGPAVIQRYRRENGSVDATMLESNGDGTGSVTMRNIWVQGQDNSGVTSAFQPIIINSSNSQLTFDNVIFDRNDWHHVGVSGANNNIYVRNSTFRNIAGNDQRYVGRGFTLNAGADTVAFENNTFFNITYVPFHSEPAPVEYFVFNHNTLVNFGMFFSAGAIWKRAYVANNVMVNPFYSGESVDLYTQPNRADPFSGVFGIQPLPSRFGLESDRRVVLANNSYWRDPEIDAYYQTFDPVVRAQPFVSDSTRSYFNRYEGMVMQNNVNERPMLARAPTGSETIEKIKGFIRGISLPSVNPPYPLVTWDPGRDVDNPLAINFPRPEDFTYSNDRLRSFGTDGLPLGDLNWYPDAKETYLANRDEYVGEIVAIAGGEPEASIAEPTVQGEDGTLNDDGAVVSVEGFTSFFFESSGSVEWTFTVPEDGTYGLNISTNLTGNNARGARFLLDGANLQNDPNIGELFFCTAAQDGCLYPLPTADEFTTLELRADQLLDNAATSDIDDSQALTLAAGAHTLRIEPVWGFQSFATIEVVDAAGTVVDELTPPEATAIGVNERCGDEDAFCAQGFQYVALDAGGSVTWTVDLPTGTGSVLPRVFYRAMSGTSAELLIDGVKQDDFSFMPSMADATAEFVGNRIDVGPGQHTFTLTSSTGGLNVDYAIFNAYAGMGTATEDGLPDGYALHPAFPNPSSGGATIRFELGQPGDVELAVFDVLGRKVMTLVDGAQSVGPHTVRVDAGQLSSGTYIYRLTTAAGAQTRRLTVVR